MKTTFKFIIAAMAAIAVFSSCQKELVNESANKTTDGVRTISVQFDNSTKAGLNGLKPSFTNNDKIRVSNSQKSEERTVTVTGTAATFTTTLTGELTAIYPAEAAVFTPGTPDGAIQSPYFKVPSSQTGKVEDAIIAKAEIAAESSIATFNGVTALFEITPPSTAKKITVTSLKKVESGSRTGTVADINTEDTGKTVITVGDGSADLPSTIYVALVPGVNLTDLSFDAGENIGLKGIPTNKLGSYSDQTAANTKYTIGNTNWHPYVEIQMNSKTYKWATMNIGASSEAEYGYYFFWGGIVGYVRSGLDWVMASNTSSVLSGGFSQNNDPHYDNTNSKYTNYTGTSGDNKPVLELADDAANSNWGGSWRMPTKAEFDAVCSLGEWKNNYKNTGVNGYLFKSGEKELFFLPAAGYGLGTGLSNVGGYGGYWSSSLGADNPNFAYFLYFFDGTANTDNFERHYGRPVRALSE